MRWLRYLFISSVCRILGLFFPQRSSLPLNPRSILVIKPCCIGDALMATATIAQLRQAFPRARMAVAVGPWAREVFEGSPHIDELINCNRVGSGRGWQDYWPLVREVERHRFDACVVLDRSPLIASIPFLARIPHRIGLDSGGRGFPLTLRVACPPGRHEAELYLDTVRALGIAPKGPRLEFFPSASDVQWAQERIASLRGKGRILALHPGGGINPGMTLHAKRWPAARYAELALTFLNAGWKVILIGGPGDEDAVAELKGRLSQSSEPENWLDLSGGAKLGQLGALLSLCQLFVGNDSGPLHLAVAISVPAVGIYGPSHPAVYGPFSPQAVAVYNGCRCNRGGVGNLQGLRCPYGHECMTSVTVEQVWGKAKKLIQDVAGEA